MADRDEQEEYQREVDEADIVDDLEPEDLYREKAKVFHQLFMWAQTNVNRINVLKGWTRRERSVGEVIALIHSELSECLEAFRKGNPECDKKWDDYDPSRKNVSLGISNAEEELADAIIRIMDLAHMKKLDVAKAFFIKMEYNKTRPYRHGNKAF